MGMWDISGGYSEQFMGHHPRNIGGATGAGEAENNPGAKGGKGNTVLRRTRRRFMRYA